MFTTAQPLRLDLAVRTSKRKKEARSPQQQRDIAEACAKANEHEIVMVHDSGGDESGKTMDRATLRAIMERIHAGKTDGLIVALTDRLGRAPIEEAMTFVRELGDVGYLVLADAGGRPVDLSDPMAETNLVLQLQMARQYWLATAKRFKQSQADAVKAGKWIGRAPFGYLRTDAGTLTPDPATADIVTGAFRVGAAGGMHAVISYMQDRVPERRWRTDEVRRMLRCRAYMGEIVYGELRNPKAHKPLTTPALWHACQTEPRHRRSNGHYPLSHVVHCDTCGHGLVGQQQTVRGVKRRRMCCSNSECPARVSVSADNLEAHVRDECKNAVRNNRFILRFVAGDLTAAKQGVELAEAEFDEFSVDREAKRMMGTKRWHAALADYEAAVAEAKTSYETIAAENGRVIELPTAAQLDDDSKLVRFIRDTDIDIRVRPGRAPIDKRVIIPDDDLDDRTRVLAA